MAKWTKGQSGNPSGRPKMSNERAALLEAIKRVEKRQGKKFLDDFVERAFTDSRLADALLRKLVPDLKSIEGKLDAGDTLHDLLAWLAGRTNGNGAKHDTSGD